LFWVVGTAEVLMEEVEGGRAKAKGPRTYPIIRHRHHRYMHIPHHHHIRNLSFCSISEALLYTRRSFISSAIPCQHVFSLEVIASVFFRLWI
jgi:hypothetical protein